MSGTSQRAVEIKVVMDEKSAIQVLSKYFVVCGVDITEPSKRKEIAGRRPCYMLNAKSTFDPAGPVPTAKMLAETLSCCPNIVSIFLNGRYFGLKQDEELATIVRSLRQLTRLEHLNFIECCIGPKTAQAFRETKFSDHESLKKFSLSFCTIVGPESDQSIGELVAKCKFNHLMLCGVNTDKTDFTKTFQAIHDSKSLEYLYISECKVSGRILEIMPELGQVKMLILKKNGFNDDDAKKIAAKIGGYQNLLSVDVRGNKFTSNGIDALAKAVAHNEVFYRDSAINLIITSKPHINHRALIARYNNQLQQQRGLIDQYKNNCLRQWYIVAIGVLSQRAEQGQFGNSIIPLASEIVHLLTGERRKNSVPGLSAMAPQDGTTSSSTAAAAASAGMFAHRSTSPAQTAPSAVAAPAVSADKAMTK